MSESVQKQPDVKGNRNYNCIDLAKFICSILVIMIHVPPFGVSKSDSVVDYLNYGVQNYLARIAVPFFFVCSGFFLYRKTPMECFHLEPTKKYVLHLLKLYAVWTLIYFPLSLYGFFKDKNGVVYAILKYIRNCFFTGSYTQLWYFPALIFAVVFISFLLYKKVTPKRIIIMAIALYIAGLFAQSWFGFIRLLREIAPSIWSILKLVQKVIVTTRDGLFDGFLFVGMGMCFAFFDCPVSVNKAKVGFGVSMLLLFIEVFLLKYLGFVRARDMYLFLIPATFFFFCFISQTTLPDSPIYKKLRSLSSLFFYSHLWVRTVVNKVLVFVYKPLSQTCLVFISTVIITLLCSLAIMKLSEHKKLKWIRSIYS